jgi:hypothetical protein
MKLGVPLYKRNLQQSGNLQQHGYISDHRNLTMGFMLFEALCYIMVEVYLVPHIFESHNSVNKKQTLIQHNAHSSTVSWGTMLQAWRSWVRLPMSLDFFFNWPNPSSRTMALGSTQPLREMSTRNLPGGKGPARKADNLTAICEWTVFKMWKPRHLTTLWVTSACYRDSFTFFLMPEIYSSFISSSELQHVNNFLWYTQYGK